MKNIIKQIREKAKMSQEQFADELGTTVVSINRWENEKSIPNKMAQKQLYFFCVNHDIRAAEFIVGDYTYKNDENKLILYHASRYGINGDIEPNSRNECDFGKGFYLGTAALQPLTLVCAEQKPVFYTTELDLTDLKVLDLDIGLDWAMLIAYNRRQMESAAGSEIYEKYAHFTDGYDIIKGYIANDRIYTELTNFFKGTITDVALMKCLAALDLGNQYVAKTQKACDRIRIVEAREITAFELSVLQDMSTLRRKEGISLADEIVKQYRREGRYFDEIIGG